MEGLRLGLECGAQHDQASATATRPARSTSLNLQPIETARMGNHSSDLFTRNYNQNYTTANHCHLSEGTRGIDLLSRQLLRTGGGVTRLTKSQHGLCMSTFLYISP